MIIFDLDGTLADCEHRTYLIDPSKNKDYQHIGGRWIDPSIILLSDPPRPKVFIPDWNAFYEACDKDEPVEEVLNVWTHLSQGEPYNQDIEIWSGRSEKVREKTLKWLCDHLGGYFEDDVGYWNRRIRMRPIGDSTPDEVLKKRWLDEALSEGRTIEYVFDDRPKVVRMWRENGIFVFDCNQKGEEF